MTDPDDPLAPPTYNFISGRARAILSLTRDEKVSAILAILAKPEDES
jgi:hypothetical protein